MEGEAEIRHAAYLSEPDNYLPWDPPSRFLVEQEVPPEEPWIETVQAIAGIGENVDAIDLFLVDPEYPGRYHTSSAVYKFCAGANFVNLRDGKVPETGKKAIMDESFGAERERRHLNHVTTYDLYCGMKSDYGFIRRTVHSENPDGWVLHALMGTARLHEKPGVGGMVVSYVEQDSSMNVTVSEEKDPVFTMGLEITFPVMRKWIATCSHRTIDRDHQLEWKGLPRRKATPLSFLSNYRDSSADFIDCIAPVHSSTLIVGRNAFGRLSWTAYSLTDAILDEYDCPCRDHALPSDADENGLEFLDPITLNEAQMASSLPPRQYFLRSATARVQQAKEEWRNTVKGLDSRMEYYFEHQPLYLHEQNGPQNASANDKTSGIRLAHDWVINTRHLLTELQVMLSKSIDCWDTFSRDDEHYFHDLAPHEARVLRTLRSQFEGLRGLLKDLDRLILRCADANKELNLHLILASHAFANQQQRHMLFTTFIAGIAFFCQPLTLTSNIFSVQEGIIPLQPNFKSFLMVFSITSVFFAVLFALLLTPKYTKKLFTGLSPFARHLWHWMLPRSNNAMARDNLNGVELGDIYASAALET